MRMRRGSRSVQADAEDMTSDVVVLTLTPEVADLLAASIAGGDAEVASQLRNVSSAIAASQATSAARAEPELSRADFLHGTWFSAKQVRPVAESRLPATRAMARPTPNAAEATASSDIASLSSADTAVPMAQAALGRVPVSEAPAVTGDVLHPTARPDHTGLSPSDEAAAVVAEAEAIAEAAVDAAAIKAANAAETARCIRAVATAVAAEVAAETAAHTADAIDAQAQVNASRVADAAARAAFTVSASILPGGEIQAALTALEVATTVSAAAVAKAHETSRAASSVAQAVLAAAAAAASTASDTEQAIALEVAGAAAHVRDLASLAARQLVVDASATQSLTLPSR